MQNLKFKILISTLLIVVGLNKSTSQDKLNSIQKVKYTILDSDSKSFIPLFFTKSDEIIFNLIELKNLKTDSIIYGVEVYLNTSKSIDTGSYSSSSIAFADGGSLWGFSSGTIYNYIKKSGYIFLDKTDVSNIINFLNEIIGEARKPQEKFILYKITVRDNFQIGMFYDPDDRRFHIDNKWDFIFKINDAVFRMKYDKGYALLLTLSKFNKFLQEN